MQDLLSFSFSGIKQIQEKNPSTQTKFLKSKHQDFLSLVKNPNNGFFYITEDQELRESCKKIRAVFPKKKTFIQIGIGGSSLGPEMLISALKKNNTHFEFINNVDPDRIHQQIETLNLDECLFYFVSKSGGTAETMAGLIIIANELRKKGLSEDQFKNYFVFATDPKKSELLELGKKWNIETLVIPSNIGGRFSVLTPVGFFPALFADIDIDQLCEGANLFKETLLKDDSLSNPLLRTASSLFELLKQKQINQTVLMPYSSLMRDFSFWFVQLWAESLGKKLNKNNQDVFTGLTPIPSYGATDQHSQVQLFMEGPKDKCFFMLQIEKFKYDYSLSNEGEIPALKKLSSYTISELFQAEFLGTLKALEQADRPYIHLQIPSVNESSIGALIIYFESLTALMGEYFNIDPFNQPGVEAGKKYAFEWLKKTLHGNNPG